MMFKKEIDCFRLANEHPSFMLVLSVNQVMKRKNFQHNIIF